MFTTAIGSAMLSAPVRAQSETASPPPDTLDAIVVTAQRRDENLQTVPLSVTAIDGRRIAEEAMLNLDRIGPSVPNLTLTRNFGTASGGLLFLRGVGEGDSIFTNDPPVGIYVDDVLFARSTGAMFDLLDVERIEVLRGPQGTLYGRNTSGGALKLVTRTPVLDQRGMETALTLGSYRRIDLRTVVNLPVGQDAAVRLAGLIRRQRGWGRNLVDGERVNGQSIQTGRMSLLWHSAEDLSVRATIDYGDDDSSVRYPQAFLPDPAAPGRYLPRFRQVSGSIDNFTSADTDWLNRTTSWGGSLHIRHDTGALTLTAITGYRGLRSRIAFDQTANPPGSTNLILQQDQRQHSFSQEVQATTEMLAGRLSLTGGAYYFNEGNDQLTAVSFATPAGTPSARFVNTDFFLAPSLAASGTGNWSPYRIALDTRSLSFYATARFALAAHLALSAGLRFTTEDKRYDVTFLAAPRTVHVLPDGRDAARRIEARWQDLSPRVAIERQFEGGNWQAMLYGSVAKGFRSGSFDGRARNIDFALGRQQPIAPETVWSYETGVKSELLDRRFRINASYFINSYRNIAFSAARANSSPPELFRQNVGDARIRGIELELAARPAAGIELAGTLGTLDDRFTRLASSPGCSAFVPDERRLDLRFTPDLRYAVRASLERPFGPGKVTASIQQSGATPYFIALCNEPQHRVANESMAVLALGYALPERGWTFTLTLNNAANVRYNSGSVGAIGYPVAPRQIDLTIQRRF